VLLWLGAVAVANYQGYFQVYPTRDAPISLATGIAHYVEDLGDEYFTFLVGPPRLYFDYGTIRFLAPAAQGVSVTDITFVAPPLNLGGRGVAFIFVPYRLDELETIQGWYPRGKLEDRFLREMREGFVAYLVSAEELAKMQDAHRPVSSPVR